ncbi:lasso RiPP family leader peptide-containing protein [Streptomyces tuirus]|uniref:Lasso RiPP family leader peptide-containing protein n=1 Tax=Streptomyces tuirus TaxID=68278 RepID=A0A941FJ92_9ACTN|nr:lasso RiPP family leader peptide-containing protein [Streptomyces tuirus]
MAIDTRDAESYEPPALVAVGEFSEDTLGFGSRYNDVLGERI